MLRIIMTKNDDTMNEDIRRRREKNRRAELLMMLPRSILRPCGRWTITTRNEVILSLCKLLLYLNVIHMSKKSYL
jgi:hypothetical protein